MLGFVDKALARFNCAIFDSHTTWRENNRYHLLGTCFLGNYTFESSSSLRVGSVEIIVLNVPHVVHAVESIFSAYIQTNAYPWE